MSEAAAFRLTPDMLAVIDAAHLCFCATVTPDGRPNVSPKGTIRAWDGARLFFLDIASPRTRANLQHSPFVELNVVDQLSRRGWRFRGTATLHTDDEVYRKATRRIRMEEGVRYEAASVVLVAVEAAEPLVSPGYLHVPDETTMRLHWRLRRDDLDAAFERFLFAEPPFRHGE
jgi:predicted pyridoxine 5'-phosphate oxidase superfamily flavin-nucleotide-binding protein